SAMKARAPSPRCSTAPSANRQARTWGAERRARVAAARWTASAAVFGRQVVRALHLDQPRGGTLERPGQPLARVQRMRRRVGGADQVDLAVVELVDQVHETARGVVAQVVQYRDTAQQQGVELARDLDVVGVAARTLAQRL